MGKASSCTIAVYIDQTYTTGLVEKAAKRPSKLFYADHDQIGDTIKELIHFLSDRRAEYVSTVVVTFNHRLNQKQAVMLFRQCGKLYKEIARHGKHTYED